VGGQFRRKKVAIQPHTRADTAAKPGRFRRKGVSFRRKACGGIGFNSAAPGQASELAPRPAPPPFQGTIPPHVTLCRNWGSPRPSLINLCSEAVRTRERVVNIGGSLRESLRRLNIDPGGESMAQFRRQMLALCCCHTTLAMMTAGCRNTPSSARWSDTCRG
jgi:hypothetical protein